MADSLTDQLAAEIASGAIYDRKTIQPAIPSLGDGSPAALRSVVQAMKTIIESRDGDRAAALDRNVTLRDLIEGKIVQVQVGNSTIGGGAGGPLGVVGGSVVGVVATEVGYVDPRPTLATPPTPTGLTAQGAFRTVILSWDLLEYANHAYVEVWRATSNSLGLAVRVGTSTANLYTDAGVVVGGTYFYWVRAVNFEGVLGAYNAVSGVSAGVLRIGNTDLSALSITAGKLASATPSMFPDQYFEGGAAVWPGTFVSRVADTAAPGGFNATFTGRDGVSWGLPVTVWPGSQYLISLWVNRDAQLAGLGVRAGIVCYFLQGDDVVIATSVSPVISAPGWQEVTLEVTAGNAGKMLVGPWIEQAHGGPLIANFANLRVERRITANLVTANMIAVGSAAIENGAIRNALIENLAVDGAKIANLAVDTAKIANLAVTGAKIQDATIGSAKIIDLEAGKITSGFIAAGRIEAGSITANKISTSSLSAISANMGTITAGTLTAGTVFAGALNAATGTFSGDISAASGSFAGSLNAATGTFAGNISAATGTFSGNLGAATLTLAGQNIFTPIFNEASTAVIAPQGVYVDLLTTGSTPSNASTNLILITVDATPDPGGETGEGGGPAASSNPQIELYRNGTGAPIRTFLANKGTTTVPTVDMPGGSAFYKLRMAPGGGGWVFRRTILIMAVNRG